MFLSVGSGSRLNRCGSWPTGVLEITGSGTGLLVGLDEGGKPEVLDLQDQDAPARVHDHKVRVLVPGANGHVVPEQVSASNFSSSRSAVRRSPGVMRATQLPRAGISVAI